jgi:hypothetical protein
MKHLIPILIVAAGLASNAAAQEPPHISDAQNNALYRRIYGQTEPQETSSPDHKLTAVYWQTHPGVYGQNVGAITIHDHDGRIIARNYLTDDGGRLVAVAHWSPDSRFCVFTTISAGGHSPWHFDPYVFSASDLSFRSLNDSVDAVIDPDFHFKSASTVYFTTREQITGLQLQKGSTNPSNPRS